MQENAVLYDRGDLDVVVVERSTDGMHELCNDPAVQTSHECPVRVGMRDVAAPSAGWGLAPCEVWFLEKGLACPCHFPGVPGDKTVWRHSPESGLCGLVHGLTHRAWAVSRRIPFSSVMRRRVVS